MFERPAAIGECHSVSQNSALHRAFDFSGAVLGLLCLGPLFCLIAAAIKMDDRGPVFYRQARVGRGFESFQVCKFRSMVNGADREGLLTAPEDTRVTCVGRLLRRYKLDELPQLFNILRGDMQFVGARPEVERYVQMFRPEYALILRDRPGLTDPATLAFRREDRIFAATGLEEQYVKTILPAKLKLSLDYQKSRSWRSDLRIVLQTVAVLFD